MSAASKPTLEEKKSIRAERREKIIATPDVLRDQILALDCFNHQKIYLLKTKTSLKGSEIAALLDTNGGAVSNVLRDYKEHPTKAVAADLLLNP